MCSVEGPDHFAALGVECDLKGALRKPPADRPARPAPASLVNGQAANRPPIMRVSQAVAGTAWEHTILQRANDTVAYAALIGAANHGLAVLKMVLEGLSSVPIPAP